MHTFSFLAEGQSLSFAIMVRVGSFIRKLSLMLYELLLKQKKNPPLPLLI